MTARYEIEVDTWTRTGAAVTITVQPLPGMAARTAAGRAEMAAYGMLAALLRHDHRAVAWRIMRVEGATRALLAAGSSVGAPRRPAMAS
jgi:hypothetical protein